MHKYAYDGCHIRQRLIEDFCIEYPLEFLLYHIDQLKKWNGKNIVFYFDLDPILKDYIFL